MAIPGTVETPGMAGQKPGAVMKRRLGCEETQGGLRNHVHQKTGSIPAKAGKVDQWALCP